MNRSARFPVVAAATLALLALSTGCNRLQARDQLNKGVQAYKSGKYEEAINHFQKASSLDPDLQNAKLYLATAYAQQVVPDLKTPENLKYANLAIDGFKEVLGKNPNDLNSLKGIAGLYFSIDDYDQAKDFQKKVISADPNDPEAHYTIGVIDWKLAYKSAREILAADGLTDQGDGNPKKSKGTCQKLKETNESLVSEGLEYLLKAVEIRPSYDDAMSYVNLTYRRKADLECGDDNARKADLEQAQKWSDKAMGTRKANEEKKESGPQGIVIDQSK